MPRVTRRMALALGASVLASPARAQQSRCKLGLEDHVKGAPVWREYDQVELDAAYDQEVYQPHTDAVNSRLSAASYDLRQRRGYPIRAAYGEHKDEGLDIYRCRQDRRAGIRVHPRRDMAFPRCRKIRFRSRAFSRPGCAFRGARLLGCAYTRRRPRHTGGPGPSRHCVGGAQCKELRGQPWQGLHRRPLIRRASCRRCSHHGLVRVWTSRRTP